MSSASPIVASPGQARRVFGWITPLASLLVVVIACLDLTGWLFKIEALIRVLPISRAGIMMPLTAIGFLLVGIALELIRPLDGGPLRRGVSRGLAAVATLLGLLILGEYLFQIDAGIDLLLFPETVQALVKHLPGRPSPNTAICLALTGCGLLFLDLETRRGRRPAQLLPLITGLVALQSLVGYAYGVEALWAPERFVSAIPPFTPMAVHTAIGFLVVSLGLLFARPDRGLAAMLTRDDLGWILLRRLLPATMLVPLLTGWLWLWGELAGLYDTAFGVSLFVMVTIVALVVLIGWSAVQLRRMDATRRNAEEALRLSEARLSGVISISAEAIIFVDAAQRITLFNASAERDFGYSAAEVLGQPHDLLIPERLRTIHHQHIRNFAAGPQLARLMGEQMAVSGRRKGGEEFPIEASIARLEVGRERLLAIVLRDITARKRIEEALRESEERFRSAYENAPIGMALVGPDGRFLQVNRALCNIVGYAQEELKATTFQRITHPEDLEADLESKRRMFAGEIPSYQMEKRYFRKDGEIVWVQLTGSLVLSEQGTPLYAIAQIQDITERRQDERGQRYLAETGPVLTSSLDPATTLASVVHLAVPALADWCGIFFPVQGRIEAVALRAAEAETERRLRELLAAYPLDPQREGSMVAHVLHTGHAALFPEVSDALLATWAEDGHHLEMLRGLSARSFMIVPLVARGRILGVILFATSGSGLRYDARDLALARELGLRAALAVDNAHLFQTAEHAIQVRDEVLRVVAHDLRSPLTGISLTAQMLSRRVGSKEKEKLATIVRAVQRANRLIQDLLDVAQIEAGQLSVEQKPEELWPIIQECMEGQRVHAEAKSQDLKAELPEALPMILADRDRVIQILSNLLGNAIKFTPTGGRLTLRAECAGEMMQIAVSDTGPGIPADDLPHLFEPFWQARKGREGAGLGLAIARGFVEAHGGRIWAESSPGSGSTFFFTLPVVQPLQTSGVAT